MIITKQSQLSELVELAIQTKIVAVDTEFFWVRTYYPELCLIQIAVGDKYYVIDTLDTSLDYSVLAEIFNNADIEKIMHSGSNDVPILKRFLNCKVNNIFDTQVASTFLGNTNQVSLKAILDEKFNIELEKEVQFSDWRKRPLTSKQEIYAINDVKYLLELRNLLKAEMQTVSTLDFFECEMKSIEEVEFTPVGDSYLKLGSIQKFSANTQKNIILLAIWREKYAQESDKPLRYILDNKVLFKLGQCDPKNINDFNDDELIKIHPKYKKQIIEALGNKESVNHLVSDKKSPTKISEELIAKINNYFDTITAKYNIDKSFISSRKNIKALAYNLKQQNNVSDNKLLNGWRKSIIGDDFKKYIIDCLSEQ